MSIENCLSNTSVLLDHKVAYILGQMIKSVSIRFLLKIMSNTEINDIVSHEAIESLGNFEDKSLINLISNFINDDKLIVSESALLAIKKTFWRE